MTFAPDKDGDPPGDGEALVHDDTHRSIAVGEDAAGDRLDAFLARAFDGLSRSRLKVLVKTGHVRVDGRTVQEPNYRIAAGEAIEATIPPPQEADPEPEDIPLTVVHEDSALIVIDKPAGLVVHPGAGNWTGTLVNALLHHCGDSLSGIGGVRRPGIVHRIDKDTSGLLVVAKTDAAHHSLSAQFADHGRTGSLERAYTALVWGMPEPPRGTVNTQIARSSHNRLRMAVVRDGGRVAITHYDAADGRLAGGMVTKVICRLETGRTHQIRVHMAHIGHPLIGDPEYGQGFKTKANLLPAPVQSRIAKMKRQALHAHLLAFSHPDDGRIMRFESPLPFDLNALFESLKEI